MAIQLPKPTISKINFGAPATSETLNAPLIEIEENFVYLEDKIVKVEEQLNVDLDNEDPEDLMVDKNLHVGEDLVVSQNATIDGNLHASGIITGDIPLYIGGLAGEDFGSVPSAVYRQEVKCWQPQATLYIDISENGGAEATTSFPTQTIYLYSDLQSGDSVYDYAQVMEEALNANAGLSHSYTVDYSVTSPGKFTISATGSFELLNSTGSNSSSNLLITLGWNATDTGTGTELSADTIAFVSSGLIRKLFHFKTDTSFMHKQELIGFVKNTPKFAQTTILKETITGFTGLVEAKDYYTSSTPGVLSLTKEPNSSHAGFSLNDTT